MKALPVANAHPSAFAPLPIIARGTRWLQTCVPWRPIRGLARFSNWCNRHLPGYSGPITLPNGVRMAVNSAESPERWLLFSGNYQPALTYVLRQHTPPGALCLDIGANLGFYTVHFAQWAGPQGQVIDFEANPAMVERIRHNVGLNAFPNVTIVSAAVHNVAGEIAFNVAVNNGRSSIHPIHTAREQITVPAITIYDYADQQHWTRLDVIKIDIEGNDCQALLGARQTLARFRPLIAFEYKPGTPSAIASAAFELLDSLHYELRTLSTSGRQQGYHWRTDPPRSSDTDIVCLPH